MAFARDDRPEGWEDVPTVVVDDGGGGTDEDTLRDWRIEDGWVIP